MRRLLNEAQTSPTLTKYQPEASPGISRTGYREGHSMTATAAKGSFPYPPRLHVIADDTYWQARAALKGAAIHSERPTIGANRKGR